MPPAAHVRVCARGTVRASVPCMQVLAKIESADAVEQLDSILDAVDGAMVARGCALNLPCFPYLSCVQPDRRAWVCRGAAVLAERASAVQLALPCLPSVRVLSTLMRPSAFQAGYVVPVSGPCCE